MKKPLERIEAAFRLLGDLELSGGAVKNAQVSSSYEYKAICEDLDVLAKELEMIQFIPKKIEEDLNTLTLHIGWLKERV